MQRLLLQWKSYEYCIFWGCVCSLRYPTCNAHAPHCRLWPAGLYSIFPQYLIKDTILGKKKLLSIMCVLIFSTTFSWSIFHSKKNWARYDKKCVLIFIESTRYFCQILIKLDFSRQIFEKFSNIKFNENPSIGRRVVACGQTDMTKLTVAFHNFANRLKIWFEFECTD